MKKRLSLFLVLFSAVTSVLLTNCKKDKDPVAPTVTTRTVTGITHTTAISGGDIPDNGGADITEKGLCWSTTENPNTANSKTTDGIGTEGFTSNLTGLVESTTYFVRAYATNSAGTTYGNQQSFTTLSLSLATIETKAVTEITSEGAVSGGTITSDGGALITAKGLSWSTSENPTIENQHTADGTGVDSFNSSLTELMPGTTYYVRAYATNTRGTAYGNQVSFITLPGLPTVTTKAISDITFTTAASGGDILSNGGSEITAKGICWSTTQNPTLVNNFTSDGSGTEGFTSNMTGLSIGTTYYVRAYATNSAGTAYGNQVTFTSGAVGLPTVTTKPVTNITFTSARSGGEISGNGGAPVTAKGICWSTSENPTIENSRTTAGSGNEGFDTNITGLTDGTTYYVRAYATNSAGTAYGNQVFFTTTAAGIPVVTTRAITNLMPLSARSGGNITGDGGAPVTAKGICWSTSENPTIADNHTSNGSGTDGYESSISELQENTTYYVRAYATNRVGTAYGNQLTMTTPEGTTPVVITTAILSVTATGGVSGGNITNDGGFPVTARGVCWSTSPQPTIAGNRTSNGSGSGTFTSSITGLSNGTVYYVRAYATNGKGTSYGDEVTFITSVADAEGNLYRTVKIGDQVWMAENLKTTIFNNGNDILNVTDAAAWHALGDTEGPAYSWYNNNTANKDLYGGIYNWFAVNEGNLCPAGWHVPSEVEFQALELTVGVPESELGEWGYRGDGIASHLKTTTGWTSSNGDNTSGFSVLPAGYRRASAEAQFFGHGVIAYFWLSTDDSANGRPEVGWYRQIDSDRDAIYKATTNKVGGKSVRCLKD